MSQYISYPDIPKAERKQLVAEAYRRTPNLRVILFAAVFVSILISGGLADNTVPKTSTFLVHLTARAAWALILCAVIWETLGRRRLKAEVEKLKNA